LQVFEGEDLANAPRLKSQAAQQRAWLKDQVNGKQARMLEEQAYERCVARWSAVRDAAYRAKCSLPGKSLWSRLPLLLLGGPS
jgi:hypothetical protein